ncbi:MAG: ASKHA domain-containing protein, partial [Deltaproteobacteria bacterium]|nr:ASKHA domain-containing protein [Deltaproteobacteria bacterium]
MQLKVTTSWNEESTVQTAPGQSLAQAVYLSGLFDVPPLCSGHSAGVSRCGRCRMRLDGALRSFPASERDFAVLGRLTVEDGWRLACRADCQELERHLAGQDASSFGVTLPDTVRIFQGATAGRAEQRKRQVKSSAQKEKVALAVDFGTTSVCWKFTDAELGSEEASMVNPQMGAGSDIMSRMSLTVPVRGSTDTSGRERLRALSVRAFVRMLEQDKSTAERSVSEIVVAGNPAMMHILLGKDVSGLCYAPYRLEYHGGAQEVLPGFPDLPPCWICPLISPFVGGDLSAGYAALAYGAQGQAQYPFLLADLGTNGEFILALDAQNALATSLPLGPALEGMGLSCGSEARDGVITGFKLTPTGLKAGFFK